MVAHRPVADGRRVSSKDGQHKMHIYTAQLFFMGKNCLVFVLYLGSVVRDHLSHAVGKKESHIVAHLSDQREGLLMVVLRFATEA